MKLDKNNVYYYNLGMNLVKDSVKLIDLAEPGRKIEYAGRVCYKSQDKISDDSYERFIKGIVNRGHTSVLEHERKMFAVAEEYWLKFWQHLFARSGKSRYFNITSSKEGKYVYISGNIRAWYELTKEESDDFKEDREIISNFLAKDYPYIFNSNEAIRLPTDVVFYGADAEKICDDLSAHKAYTFEIVGSRSFTHQVVRHRTLSFSQESQRYCNYTAGKFGSSIKVIGSEVPDGAGHLLNQLEELYFDLIEKGAKPEEARQILPNCTASTIVVTGTLEDWKKFLHLRVDEHAQREIREIAINIMHDLHLTKSDIGL